MGINSTTLGAGRDFPTLVGARVDVYGYDGQENFNGKTSAIDSAVQQPTSTTGLDADKGQEFDEAVAKYEDWLEKSGFNYTTDTMVVGPQDPLLDYIQDEFPEILIVQTVKSRSYVR